MKLFAVFAFLLMTLAPAASAQTLDPQAALLKAQIEGFLETQKAAAKKNGCTLAASGGVTVEKAAGYYAFTLPHLTFTDAKGVRTDLGMVAVNATPDGSDNWKVSLALPTPVNSFDAAGKQIARTDIGSQSLTGIWNVKLGHFAALGGNLSNVRVHDLVEQNTITIGNVALKSELSPGADGVWSGTANKTLSNISLFSADTNFTGTLPKIVMTTALTAKAAPSALTKEQIMARPQNGSIDPYNAFATLLGTPGNIQAVVTGLDSINTQLQQAMIVSTPTNRPKFLSAIVGVSAASGIGRPVPNDSTSKSYDVAFGSNGAVSINGTDFGTLIKKK